MPFTSSLRLIAVAAAIAVRFVGLPDHAVAQGTSTGKKLRLADVNALLWAGNYDRAVTAADEVAGGGKPTPRDKDYLPRMIEFIHALERRGYAELRLGRLDDAAATLLEAQRAARDPDLKRFLELAARGKNAAAIEALVRLDVNVVEILDLRMAVILERLRFAALDSALAGPVSAEQSAELRTQVGKWLDEFETLGKTSVPARKALAHSLEDGGPAVLGSPYDRSVAGRFRPALAAGMRSLEVSRLPAESSPAPADAQAAEPVADSRRARLDEALRSFDEAAAALDEAVAAAAPQGVESLKPEARIEADLLRAELLTCQGEALLESEDPASGRERAAEAENLLRAVAVRRNLMRPDAHADLLLPLLVQAEALRAEMRRAIDAGDAARALDLATAASTLLARVDALPVPEGHPFRTRVTNLRTLMEQERSAVDAALPAFDAAAAAARRLRRAVDMTDVSNGGFVP